MKFLKNFKKSKKRGLTPFVLLVALAACAAGGDDITVRASVDKKKALIGDRVRYAIEVRTPKGVEVEFPKFADNKIGDFEIKDSASKGNSRWYYIASYSAARAAIPPIEIKYRKKGADWKIAKTKPIEVIVGSVLPRGQPIYDIKDIKGPLHFFEINWFIVSAVAIVIGLSVAVFIHYRRKKRLAALKLPHETALEELEAIRAALARGGSVKEFYINISDCVRRYIERAFKVKAPEMTTEEFLDSMRESGALSAEHKKSLGDFLAACDLVKFAKYAPAREEVEAVFTTAKRFIEETKR